MANMNIRVHFATGARLESHCHDNARHFSLVVTRETRHGGDVEFSIFDMPEDVVAQIIDAFGMPRRFDYHNSAAVYPAEMQALKDRVAELERELADAMVRGEREAV